MNENEYRILERRIVGFMRDGTAMVYIEAYGNSSWAAPTDGGDGAKICAGSLCTETDTGKVYIYDEEDGWTEVGA